MIDRFYVSFSTKRTLRHEGHIVLVYWLGLAKRVSLNYTVIEVETGG